MIIGIRDTVKLSGISVIACCAVFVCTLFLNYSIDLTAIEDEITSEAGIVMYNAQVSTGKITSAVTGGCLIITSAVMLLFYIKNYIDIHSKELGILKALGYSDIRTAGHFRIFGLSVFAGCALGFTAAFLYLPTFYEVQNAEKLFPEFPVRFHLPLAFLLIGVPTAVFTLLSVLYAYFKLKNPVSELLRGKQEQQTKTGGKENESMSFLQDLTRNTLKSKKTLVFFITFSAFCFSAMVQMSMSMKSLSSETFAFMMITIGLILAFVTLFLSLSSVIKGNTKTLAMMRVFGYEYSACSRAVLGGYRPFSYIGFALGTVYQYGLLKIMVTVIFADVGNMPEYSFDFKALVITLILFILTYETVLRYYSLRIKRLPLKSVMLE